MIAAIAVLLAVSNDLRCLLLAAAWAGVVWGPCTPAFHHLERCGFVPAFVGCAITIIGFGPVLHAVCAFVATCGRDQSVTTLHSLSHELLDLFILIDDCFLWHRFELIDRYSRVSAVPYISLDNADNDTPFELYFKGISIYIAYK